MKILRKISVSTALVPVCVATVLTIGACDEVFDDTGSSTSTYDFVCENGTPVSGKTTIMNKTACLRCDSGYVINVVTDALACVAGVGFSSQITADDNDIGIDSATLTITPSHSGTLYWIAYADGATAPTDGATLINNAGDTSIGLARSGTTGETVTGGQPNQFTVPGLNALTDYDLYAVLSTTVDDTVRQALSLKYDLATAGYAYVCDNGTAASGESATQNDNKCKSCEDTHYLHGGSESCVALGTLQDGYGVLANGVTIDCSSSSIANNDSFSINGTLYTKRTANQITATNAVTSCTSGITDMSNLFQFEGGFDADISTWDTASVQNMSGMFYGALAFDQDIGDWNTAQVTDMSQMFRGAGVFNQDISGWNTANVTDMSEMFYSATDFEQNIGNWDTAQVTDMNSMFQSARSFDGDISGWTVSAVTDMSNMFRNAPAFNQNIGGWTVSAVTDMSGMFFGAEDFDQNIGGWTVSAVTDMSDMFSGASAFNQNIGGWTVSAVTDMSGMFFGAEDFDQNIDNWDVSAVTDMSYMFQGTDDFNQDLSNWDVSSVTDMGYMFWNAGAFDQDISNWDVSSVTVMDAMFANAAAFDRDISAWCVQLQFDSKPTPSLASFAFDFNTLTSWTDAKQPQWSASSTANSCPINFVRDPSAGGVDGRPVVNMTTLTATSADINVVSSRTGTLYWIVYLASSSDAPSDVAALRAAIAADEGVVNSGTSGEPITDDAQHVINITTDISGGNSYRIYVGLELNDNGTLETDLATPITFTTPN